jgi:hypothetical protein
MRELRVRNPAQSHRSAGRTRYWCIACSRPRSSTYHSRHPPDEPPPPPGVCRRCVKEELREHHCPPATVKIYEVHHYHHTCGCLTEQPHAGTPVEPPPYPESHIAAELPELPELAADESRGRPPCMGQLSEMAPPPVKYWMKPVYQST